MISVLCCVVLRCVALRFVVLCCVALRCVALRCVVLCWVVVFFSHLQRLSPRHFDKTLKCFNKVSVNGIKLQSLKRFISGLVYESL